MYIDIDIHIMNPNPGNNAAGATRLNLGGASRTMSSRMSLLCPRGSKYLNNTYLIPCVGIQNPHYIDAWTRRVFLVLGKS